MRVLQMETQTIVVQDRPLIGPLIKPVTEVETEKREIYYPDSDGEPMGETGFHVQQILSILAILRDRFRRRKDVYAGADMFFYYRRGDPSAVFAPDVFVVFDTTDEERRSWKVWEEDGRTPTVVFEITSKETQEKDVIFKRALYEHLGVMEYILFDPLAEYLEPVLQGYRLVEGRYEPLPEHSTEGGMRELESAVLDVTLRVEEGELALYDRESGEKLLVPQEAYERLREETVARRAAESRAKAAEVELARLRAELARLREDTTTNREI
jgi:Uma2 family endonuclease